MGLELCFLQTNVFERDSVGNEGDLRPIK